jgi:Integrase
LQFTILTAARTSEVLAASWSEVDLAEATWTVPAARMKAGKEHRVPLPPAALAVLTRVPAGRPEQLVFADPTTGRRLSINAMPALLKRMGATDLTVHGFRSTFRDWAAERTTHPAEVVEAALAHAISNKVEAAYRRGDLFEKRRLLMNEWAEFIAQTSAAESGDGM